MPTCPPRHARWRARGKRFEPQPDAVRTYDALYREVYKPLYSRLEPLYKRIPRDHRLSRVRAAVRRAATMRRRRAAVAAALLLGASGAAPAYESDFHYGLTWWLAIQAGFDPQQSHDLARGDERTDTGMLDAKHAIVWQLCFPARRDRRRADPRAPLSARRTGCPRRPADRPVQSVAPFAAAALKAVLGEVGTDPRDRLIRFGRALHGWQDTFAHRGEPAGLPACPVDWSWAHPRDRNGPASHDADLTHFFIDDCLEAARSSYEHLRAYRKALKLPLASARPWSALASRALAFCGAETKAAKADWFVAQKVPQAVAIAANTNLPDGARRFRNAPAIDLGEDAARRPGPRGRRRTKPRTRARRATPRSRGRCARSSATPPRPRRSPPMRATSSMPSSPPG
jgi:hypothetical protein